MIIEAIATETNPREDNQFRHYYKKALPWEPSVKEAADTLNVSESTVRRACKKAGKGRFHFLRHNSIVCFIGA